MEQKFVKISYTGKVKDGEVFDTTDIETARKEGIFEEKRIYAPVPIIVGERHVLAGLDEALKDMKAGEQKEIAVEPEKAYGPRDPNLVKLVPMKVFKQQKITPIPGMKLELDGRIAKIQTVSGGRVRVDFNSDLAGRELVYDIKVDEEATDDSKKIDYLIERSFNTAEGFKSEIKGKDLQISIPEASYRDRNALLRKASLAAELFKFLDFENVSFTETWQNRVKAAKAKAEAKETAGTGGEKEGAEE